MGLSSIVNISITTPPSPIDESQFLQPRVEIDYYDQPRSSDFMAIEALALRLRLRVFDLPIEGIRLRVGAHDLTWTLESKVTDRDSTSCRPIPILFNFRMTRNEFDLAFDPKRVLARSLK